MPIIFYDQAIRAVANGRKVDWVKDEHLTDWQALASALEPLTPEQRCDAIYADWLLQLNSPAHLALLQVRNLLIGQGALAANYLAELAQNADDASDGDTAHIRIELNGDWLFVSNNGRKVTPLNLLGLSRFFVHTAGKVVELNEQTIGKFGIGFKSCYRIASEVFVHSWDAAGSFGFRLPVCREGDAASHPDSSRLHELVDKLRGIGVTQLDQNPNDVSRLGYCTPEFCNTLPASLAEKTTSLCATPRGTLFCFRIRPDRLADVQSRISDQAHNVYELCPLFLPNLRLVRLGAHELEMREIRHDTTNDLPGKVEAIKVELTTRTDGEKKPSNSRFWRLKGIGDGDVWQVALHADQKFRLRVEQEDDEHGTTIKDGAAYAFFPLNAVTNTWPFRLHLHIKLPTNLARNDWNPDEATQVHQQIQRAVEGVTTWLERHTDKWHPDWRIESLIVRRPGENEIWASRLWDCFRGAIKHRNLLRSLGGNLTKAANAKTVALVKKPEVADAWRCVTGKNPHNFTSLVTANGDAELVSASLSTDELSELCVAAIEIDPKNSDIHQSAITALLGTVKVSLSAVENLVSAINCNRENGDIIPLRQLLEQPAGDELSATWHSTFARLAKWSPDLDWREISVCGLPLRRQLQKLATPVFNPTWKELPTRLADESMWQHHGEAFWQTPRSECPNGFCDSAVNTIRTQIPDGTWVPLPEIWPLAENQMNCLGSAFKACVGALKYPARKHIADCLEQWGLYITWMSSAQERIEKQLPESIANTLTKNVETDSFSLVFNHDCQEAHRRLPSGWKAAVTEAQKNGVLSFLAAWQKLSTIKGKTVISRLVDPSIRDALSLLPEYIAAPTWLTEEAYQHISNLGLRSECDFVFLSQSEVANQQESLARELLEKFYQWQSVAITPTARTGLGQLSAATSLTKRRDWLLGLGPQKTRSLRDLIVPAAALTPTTAASRLEAMMLAGAKWDGEDLPASLTAVGSLAEACIQPSKLTIDAIPGTLTPLETEQLPAELTDLPDFHDVLSSGHYRLLGSPNELNLKWRYEGDIVARRDDAPFAIEADRIVVHRFRPPADEEQCKRVLAVFETNSTATRSYEADAVLSPFERYQKHRDTIRQTLLKELVVKVGYEKHHILRELLQNAESAYASKKNPPADAWFEFSIIPASAAGRRKVVARHAGRAFNEPDVLGHARHDVERIWRMASENERTADEVGRFNRGFKTLFTVAANGAVHIRSGDFDFEVIDLLMLKPANPQPKPAKHSPLTEFTFEAGFQDALDILRLEAAPGANTNLRVVSAATFVFLARLHRVSVTFERQLWQWRIARADDLPGWKLITISKEGSASPERFLVFSGAATPQAGATQGRRFATAVRLDSEKLPTLLDKQWRKFHLTFETEHDFPLDFLVNGDFDADQGRVGLRNIARSGLVELAYEAVIQRAATEIRKQPTPAVWLAWARVLHLKDAPTELNAASDLRPLHRHAEKAAETLAAIVPHDGELVSASTLDFPSLLLRRLGGIFGSRWHFTQRLWINVEIASALPDSVLEQKRVNFLDWVLSQQPESPILKMVDADLRSAAFTTVRLSATEKDEFDKAKVALAEKLRPVVAQPPPDPEIPVVEAWSVENLWHWWERRNKPISDYTLEGTQNWQLLYGNDAGDTSSRQTRLKADLLSVLSPTPSPQGLRVWYRLFGLACLMSAGRRMSEIRAFWSTELDGNQFWEKTSAQAFSGGTDALFAEVTTRPFTNLTASGENAYFWRRVFYDIRKIHRLVWEDHFPATLLELVQSGRAAELLNFLKTGFLPGQKPWVGVFGQSAGAPLFFVVRELCRLGVIPMTPDLSRLSFFVSTPARRAMERIGWLTPDAANRVDFESLSSLSDALYRRIAADRIYGPRLLPYYDIPLMHLGLEG